MFGGSETFSAVHDVTRGENLALTDFASLSDEVDTEVGRSAQDMFSQFSEDKCRNIGFSSDAIMEIGMNMSQGSGSGMGMSQGAGNGMGQNMGIGNGMGQNMGMGNHMGQIVGMCNNMGMGNNMGQNMGMGNNMGQNMGMCFNVGMGGSSMGMSNLGNDVNNRMLMGSGNNMGNGGAGGGISLSVGGGGKGGIGGQHGGNPSVAKQFEPQIVKKQSEFKGAIKHISALLMKANSVAEPSVRLSSAIQEMQCGKQSLQAASQRLDWLSDYGTDPTTGRLLEKEDVAQLFVDCGATMGSSHDAGMVLRALIPKQSKE